MPRVADPTHRLARGAHFPDRRRFQVPGDAVSPDETTERSDNDIVTPRFEEHADPGPPRGRASSIAPTLRTGALLLEPILGLFPPGPTPNRTQAHSRPAAYPSVESAQIPRHAVPEPEPAIPSPEVHRQPTRDPMLYVPAAVLYLAYASSRLGKFFSVANRPTNRKYRAGKPSRTRRSGSSARAAAAPAAKAWLSTT